MTSEPGEEETVTIEIVYTVKRRSSGNACRSRCKPWRRIC